MKPTDAQNDSAPAPGAKTDAQKNLKSVPMPELEKSWARRRMASVKPRRRNG